MLKIELFWSDADSQQQYSPIKAGAEAATKTATFQQVEKHIRLDEREDPDSPEAAARVARSLRLDPSVLAVVGHSNSGTTRAALPYYAEAGIPILMPAATSPYLLDRMVGREPWSNINSVLSDTTRQQFSNAFRLIPSDVPDQVHAIELTIQELNVLRCESRTKQPETCTSESSAQLYKPKVMVICDTTKRTGAGVYTKPMCDSIRDGQRFMKFRSIASYRAFDIDSNDVHGLVTEIHAVKPDYVVLLGYPELARDVLEELKERSANAQEMSNDVFIMSEACLTEDLLPFGASIYVTSPYNFAQTKTCSNQLSVPKGGGTYESYAFDAVIILAEAVESCLQKETLGRACVRQYLESNNYLRGECEEYHIDRGERQDAPYHVYSACNGNLRARWSAKTHDSELRENVQWCKGDDK